MMGYVEMRAALQKLSGTLDNFDYHLRSLKHVDFSYDVLLRLTGGVPFEQFNAVHLSSWIYSACISGQLTAKELPDKVGVYVDAEFLRNKAHDLTRLAQMNIESLREINDKYSHYVPMLKRVQIKADFAAETCLKVAKMIDDYTAESIV